MADDVVAALDALGVRDAVVVAHSLGGVVAFRLAAARPQSSSRCWSWRTSARRTTVTAAAATPDGVELPFDWDVVPAIAARVGRDRRRRLGGAGRDRRADAAGRRRAVEPRAQERLDEVAARVPDCSMVTIDGGHHVHRAEPEAFAAAVLGWLYAHA